MWVMCFGTKPSGNQQNDNDDDSTVEVSFCPQK